MTLPTSSIVPYVDSHADPSDVQPEFQGGWIPGTDTTGYNLDACLPLFSSQFERVFYLNNVAQCTCLLLLPLGQSQHQAALPILELISSSAIKLQSVYMTYGGTNYGHTAFPRTHNLTDIETADNHGSQVGSHRMITGRLSKKTVLFGTSTTSSRYRHPLTQIQVMSI